MNVLSRILQSSVAATTHREADYCSRSADQCHQQEQLLGWLSVLLNVAVEFLSGSHSVQFTALVLINKIIDVATATGLVHVSPYRSRDRDRDRDRQQRHRQRQAPTRSHGTCRPADKSGNHVPTGSWKQAMLQEVGVRDAKCDADESEDAQQSQQQQQQQQPPCGLGQLMSQKIHAGTVLSLILNAITLQRRVVGTRTRCTPSQRMRQCSYHCLQILSGRVLLFLAQTTHSRDQLIQEAQLRMLIEALDYTLDPQLLCLVLQTVALLALDFEHQPALLQSGIPDALTQLVLPSDEWYYTNHTTRFSRIVKYHAARVLVYLGLAKCLGPRVSLFDYQPGNAHFIVNISRRVKHIVAVRITAQPVRTQLSARDFRSETYRLFALNSGEKFDFSTCHGSVLRAKFQNVCNSCPCRCASGRSCVAGAAGGSIQ